MPAIARSRARLPLVQRSLQPPDPYRLATEAILEEGRRERRQRALEWQRATSPWMGSDGEDALTS
jgi:hypothetical protein